jgi:hypothetical protein
MQMLGLTIPSSKGEPGFGPRGPWLAGLGTCGGRECAEHLYYWLVLVKRWVVDQEALQLLFMVLISCVNTTAVA